jgi:glucose/arabinose dehydrogenase
MKETFSARSPGGRRFSRGESAVRRVLAVAALGAALVLGSGPAGTAGVAAQGAGESPFGGAFDLRPVPVRELRAEGEWPPEQEPWKATHSLMLPPAFRATVFAKFETPIVRGLAVGPAGELYVSRPQDGAVDQLYDRDKDGFAEVRQPVLTGLDCPHGLVVSGGWLYAAQLHRVERFPLHGGNGSPTATPGGQPESVTVGRQGEVVADDLPDGPCGDHGYRSVAVDPAQGELFVGIGMLCNVCVDATPEGAMRATVRSYTLPPTQPAPAAQATQPAQPTPGAASGSRTGVQHSKGMRNVVFLAINPWDGTLWGTNIERDEQGDDEPPEHITRIPDGGSFGWPYCYRARDGSWRPDPRIPPLTTPCGESGLTAPTVTYQAHSTPLGLAFHDGNGLPPAFGPSLFVALHGSWNHTTGVGYKVIRVPLDDAGQPSGPPREFATGWLPGLSERAPEGAWGRPAGVVVGPDGELYVADDKGGLVYRFAYTRR